MSTWSYVPLSWFGSLERNLHLMLTLVGPFHRGKYAAEGRVGTFYQLMKDRPYYSDCLKIFPEVNIFSW